MRESRGRPSPRRGGECIAPTDRRAPARGRRGARRRKSREKRGRRFERPVDCAALVRRGRSAPILRRRLYAHEAHLPAQEAQARPHPRVPRAHAHARGARDAQAPPRQGPQARSPRSDGCARRARRAAGARKRRRLSRSAEFDRVYREGRSHASRYLVVYAFPRDGRPGTSPARRLGRPQGRRRRGAQPRKAPAPRGLLGARPSELPDGHDFVVVARPDAGELARERARRGSRRRSRELLDGRPRRGGGDGVSALRASIAVAPIRALPAAHLAGAAAPLQVPSDAARRTRSRRSAPTAYSAGLVLAGWRLLRCNPWSHGGVDPGRGPDACSAAHRAAPLSHDAMYSPTFLQPLDRRQRRDPQVLARPRGVVGGAGDHRPDGRRSGSRSCR